MKKSKFKKNDLVRIKPSAINDGELMIASMPQKHFSLNEIYVVKEIGLYTDGFHVLVYGSSQFVHQKYFKKLKDSGNNFMNEFKLTEVDQMLINQIEASYRELYESFKLDKSILDYSIGYEQISETEVVFDIKIKPTTGIKYIKTTMVITKDGCEFDEETNKSPKL
jgi:hypothetical protein